MGDRNNICQVNNSMVNKKLFKDVAFFMIAESGAMGEPGCIIWLQDDGSRYHGNFCFGDIDLNKIDKLFPVLPECEFGIFGLDSKVPEGWQYVNLGMGNHLIVNDKHYPLFQEETKDLEEPVDFYQNWYGVADKILDC